MSTTRLVGFLGCLSIGGSGCSGDTGQDESPDTAATDGDTDQRDTDSQSDPDTGRAGTDASSDGQTDDGDACAGLDSERAPSISMVSSNVRIFDSDSSLSFTASAGAQTEVQILRRGDVVWRAVVAPGATSVALDDGEFLATPAELTEWKKHTARARAFDGTCARSAWSSVLEFRSDDGSYDLFSQSAPLAVSLSLSDASYDAIAAEANPPGVSYPYTRFYYA
ncbi:MAG: hypothetical protein JKY37_33910, partial [Nannocystaceae bacterium]|nr:hypothetical protein [Nannocystaceae bacterium]